MTKSSYTNPPLVQALLELSYDEKFWDMTLPGRFYAQVQSVLPTRQELKSTRFSMPPGQPGFKREELPQVRLSSEDGKHVVQLGPGTMAVSRLAPYQTWADFKRTLLANLGVLESVLPREGLPERYRAVLRYINRFPVENGLQHAQRLLTVCPAVPETLRTMQSSYLLQLQYPQSGSDEVLVLVTGTVPSSPSGGVFVMLDISYQSPRTSGVPRGSISKWAESAHDRIEDTFEKSITDEARKHFS